jgi:hypothetical protein
MFTAAVLLGACHEGGEASPVPSVFLYDLTQTSTFDLQSRDAAGPLPGVLVSVRTASTAPTSPGELLWMGVTGPDGHARAAFRTDHAGDAPLDVVVNKPGWKGPYADESIRAAAGIFAPSARISVPLDALSGITVAMEPAS